MILASEIDLILTAQLVVAWAGEKGEDRRLGWWQSDLVSEFGGKDLVSEFGGKDLFKQLMPHTWEWAVLQAAREAARRCDAELRHRDHDPDRILSLYNLGFAVDERTDERLLDLKRSGVSPFEVLPGLKEVLTETWQAKQFGDWVQGHGKAESVSDPIGRRLKGDPPESLELLVNRLVSAYWPFASEYPLPHFRRAT
jgi:hypothetical protein